MPLVDRWLHYRVIDVSSIKELTKRWYSDLSPPKKMGNHLALDDIRESIEELRYYRAAIFRDEPLSVASD
jgi:oligoribonuclease